MACGGTGCRCWSVWVRHRWGVLRRGVFVRVRHLLRRRREHLLLQHHTRMGILQLPLHLSVLLSPHLRSTAPATWTSPPRPASTGSQPTRTSSGWGRWPPSSTPRRGQASATAPHRRNAAPSSKRNPPRQSPAHAHPSCASTYSRIKQQATKKQAMPAFLLFLFSILWSGAEAVFGIKAFFADLVFVRQLHHWHVLTGDHSADELADVLERRVRIKHALQV